MNLYDYITAENWNNLTYKERCALNDYLVLTNLIAPAAVPAWFLSCDYNRDMRLTRYEILSYPKDAFSSGEEISALEIKRMIELVWPNESI